LFLRRTSLSAGLGLIECENGNNNTRDRLCRCYAFCCMVTETHVTNFNCLAHSLSLLLFAVSISSFEDFKLLVDLSFFVTTRTLTGFSESEPKLEPWNNAVTALPTLAPARGVAIYHEISLTFYLA
jgi:hypothetical protein